MRKSQQKEQIAGGQWDMRNAYTENVKTSSHVKSSPKKSIPTYNKNPSSHISGGMSSHQDTGEDMPLLPRQEESNEKTKSNY